MKLILMTVFHILSAQFVFAQSSADNDLFSLLGIDPFRQRSLVHTSHPSHYRKREAPVLNIGLIYYGGEFDVAYLNRIASLLEQRFRLATDKQIGLNIVAKEVIPYKHNISKYPQYSQPQTTELDRLQRLWYYDNVGYNLSNEVHEMSKKNKNIRAVLRQIDALVVITGAQFEALGFADGRIAITENPREVAWQNSKGDGGFVEIASDYHVVDELIHEIGHTLFLDHASRQCNEAGLPIGPEGMDQNALEERAACCLASPAKDDVMSYCRSRDSADETHFNKFESCNLKFIKDKIVPALLSGGSWSISGVQDCR